MPTLEEIEARLNALALEYDPLKRNTLVELDPFLGSANQTHRMRAYCVIIIGGFNITDKIAPFLISVRIVDGEEVSCEIEVDDRDGLVPLPPLGAECLVELGWAHESMVEMFHGPIQDVEHGFGRKQGGRRMWIHAKGLDHLKSKMKEPMQMNLGEGAPPGQKEGKKHSLSDWIQKLAEAGGGKANVAGKFAANMQDYFGAMGASPMHQIIEEGRKHGAMVQGTTGNTWNFEDPGQRGISCHAIWRENLIGYRVRPFVARGAYGKTFADWFDKAAGQHTKKILDLVTKGLGPAADAAAGGGGAAPQATDSGSDQANQGAADNQDFK